MTYDNRSRQSKAQFVEPMESRTFLSTSPAAMFARHAFGEAVARPMFRVGPFVEHLIARLVNSSFGDSSQGTFATATTATTATTTTTTTMTTTFATKVASFTAMSWHSSALESMTGAAQDQGATDDAGLGGAACAFSTTDVYSTSVPDMTSGPGGGGGYRLASLHDADGDAAAPSRIEREYVVTVFIAKPVARYLPGMEPDVPPVTQTPEVPAPQAPTPTAPITRGVSSTTNTTDTTTTTTTATSGSAASAPLIGTVRSLARSANSASSASRNTVDSSSASDALAARLGSESENAHLTPTSARMSAAAAGVATAARSASGAVFSAFSRSTIPFDSHAATGFMSMQMATQLESAVAVAAAPTPVVPATVDVATHLVPSSPRRVFEFAQLGSPFALLADSVAGFVDESASLPRVQSEGQRHVAWLITAMVVAADAVLLTYSHRRSNKLRSARAVVRVD